MDRVAVFVDAGYLYAGGSTSIAGVSKKRTELTLNVPAVVQYLMAKAEAITQQKLLRIYWYDGALTSRLATDHQLLASSDNVKLRLGIINGFGEQKGVDAKIITDLADLARNGAFSDAVLVGGDEDLRIGVELAQERGTRVHLLTVEGSSSSPSLRQEADTVSTIARTDIQTFLSVVIPVVPAAARLAPTPTTAASSSASTPATSTPAPAVAATASIGLEVTTYLASLSPAEHVALTSAIQASNTIPTEHDGRLLARARTALGRPLDWPEKAALRKALKRALGL